MDRRAIYYTCGSVAKPDRDGTWRLVSDPKHPALASPMAAPGMDVIAVLSHGVLGPSLELRSGEAILSSQASIVESLAEKRLPEPERREKSIALRAMIYHLRGLVLAYVRIRQELQPIIEATKAEGQRPDGILTPSVDEAHHEWTAFAMALGRLGIDIPGGLAVVQRRLIVYSERGRLKFRLPLEGLAPPEAAGSDLLTEAKNQVARALDGLELAWRRLSPPPQSSREASP